jgi:hypothetical protein
MSIRSHEKAVRSSQVQKTVARDPLTMAGLLPGSISTVSELLAMKPTDAFNEITPIASVCTLGRWVSSSGRS